MAFVHGELVLETSTTTGTGTLTLAGAVSGHRTFAAGVGEGNTCAYSIEASNGQKETGIGTVGSGTLARTTLKASSTGSKLDLPAGTHYVGVSANSESFTPSAVGALASGTKLDDLAAPDNNTDLDASTSAHGLVVKATAPASGIRNIVAIDNGETAYKNTALFDTTNPAALGTAAPGTSLIAARRDHVHATPAASTGVMREFWVGAGAMAPRKTAGATAATDEYTTNDVTLDWYLFDSVTEEAVQFLTAMPDAWDRGNIKAKFFWDACTNASADDVVRWTIAARAMSNDDAIDAAFPTATTVDDAVIAVADTHVTAATSAFAISGTPAIGDMIVFQITRYNSGVSGNMSEDAKFFGIQIQYTESTTAPSAW
jgi:hypothetical protein